MPDKYHRVLLAQPCCSSWSDPARLLEGTGAKMRHVKVRSLEDAAKPALTKLLAAALAERKRAG